MKVFGRIMYALAVAIALIVFHNLGNRIAADKYLNEVGKEMYLSNHEDKYRMFYGSTGFHLNQPTYEFNENLYHLQVYEINKVFVNRDKDVRVDEYYYIMVSHEYEVLTIDHPQKYYMRFTNNLDEVLALEIHQFKEIPFSVVVNEDDEGLIEANRLIDNNYNKLEIIEFDANDESETVLATFDFSFLASDLIMKQILTINYQDEELLNANGINYRYRSDSSSYNYLYYIVMGAYIVFASLVTFVLFFMNKNKPGKVKPSEHFYDKESSKVKAFKD